jgi:amylosucrase
VVFADIDNRRILSTDNPHLLVFSRTDPHNNRNRVLVVGNFGDEPQSLNVDVFRSCGFLQQHLMKDLYSGRSIVADDETVAIPARSFYWLTD